MNSRRLTQFLLSVFAMLFAVAPGAGAQSTEEKIVFVHYGDSADDSDIYVMDADGSNPTNLSNDAGDNGGPAWSPDGSLIAYTVFIPGANPWEGYTDIYVMNADGSNPTNLTNNSGYDTHPAWSPDGSQIAFSSLGRTPSIPFGLEIYVMDADGSNPTPLTDHLDSDEPAWSPDGTQIAFTSAEGTSHEIYVMDADGSNPTNLTNTSPLVRDTAPAWSPDGTRIAFLSDRDGTREIYVMDPDGSNPTNLTNNDAEYNLDPAWSPDGSLIAFSSMRCGGAPWDCTEEIYVIDATDGSNETSLTGTLDGQNSSPAWASLDQSCESGECEVTDIILDIHPIQVTQFPAGGDSEEFTPLFAQKATMIRVFIDADESYFTDTCPVSQIPGAATGSCLKDVKVRCELEGAVEEHMVNLWQGNSETLVQETHWKGFSPPIEGLDECPGLEKCAAQCFRLSDGIGPQHPSHGNHTFEVSLELPGGEIVTATEEHHFHSVEEENEFKLLFVFMDSTVTTFSENPQADYAEEVNDFFERSVSSLPIPRERASYTIASGVRRIGDHWFHNPFIFDALGWALWLSPNVADGEKYYDRIVFVVPGEADDGTPGLLQDQLSGGEVVGFTHWFFRRIAVFVQHNANGYVLPHELGHAYHTVNDAVLEHDAVTGGGIGWDPRELDRAHLRFKAPSSLKNLMSPSSGSNTWDSHDNYEQFIKAFRPELFSKRAAKKKPPEDLLVIPGMLGPGGESVLFPVVQASGTPDPVAVDGDFTLRVVSAAGSVLTQTELAAQFLELGTSGSLGAPFVIRMSHPAGAARIELLEGDTLLDTVEISANAPALAIVELDLSGSPEVEVAINASDADGDSLEYLVTYSPDGERRFALDPQWLDADRLRVDLTGLPGSGSGRIRVLATDGANSTSAETATFALPNLDPFARILTPMDGAVFATGGSIGLSSSTMDPEDGNLAAADLAWSSSLAGALGTGHSQIVQADDLGVGTHVITFTAGDGSGGSASDTIEIEIGADPPPNATAGEIRAVPPHPSEGEAVALRASLESRAQDLTATVTLFDGDPASGGSEIGSSEVYVAANSRGFAEVPWTPGAQGVHEIFAVLSGVHVFGDPDDAESNTSDNQASSSIRVLGPPAASISSLSLDFGLERSVLAFIVENTGGGDLNWTLVESGDAAGAVSLVTQDDSGESSLSGTTSGGGRSIVLVRLDRDVPAFSANSVSLGFTSNGGTFGVGVEIDAPALVPALTPPGLLGLVLLLTGALVAARRRARAAAFVQPV